MFSAVKKGILSLLCCCTALCAQPAPVKGDFPAYIAGITLLKFGGLTPRDQQAHYKKLERVTGVTAAMAETYISTYKNKPARWQKLQDQVITLLQGETDTCPPLLKNSPTRISNPK